MSKDGKKRSYLDLEELKNMVDRDSPGDQSEEDSFNDRDSIESENDHDRDRAFLEALGGDAEAIVPEPKEQNFFLAHEMGS